MTPLFKNTYREILRSPGRFLAILAIIVLGSGFFVGLRVSKNAMIATADEYYSDTEFFDFSLANTLGYEAEDLEEIRKSPLVLEAEGTFETDALVSVGGVELVYKFHSLPEVMNTPVVVEGRLPETPDECLGDSWTGLKIGDTVTVSASNDDDTGDLFKEKTFTVTGLATSPLYLNFERGSTDLGSGSVSGFCYVLPEAFDADYFTGIYIRCHDMPGAYSEKYDSRSEELEPEVTELAEKQAQARFDRILSDAQAEIDDGEQEYADALEEYRTERADAERELEDAYLELEDARRELEDGAKELEDGKKEIADGELELADSWNELEKARAELEDGKKELEDSRKEIDDGWAEYEKSHHEFINESIHGQAQLDTARQDLEAAKEQLEAAESEYSAGWSDYQDGVRQYEEGQAALEQMKAKYDQLAQSDPTDPELPMLNAQIAAGAAQLESARRELDSADSALSAASAEISDGWREYNENLEKYNEAEEEFKTSVADAQAQLDDAKRELEDGEREYSEGVQEHEDGQARYEDGLKKYEDGRAELDRAKRELEDAQREYDDGLREYEDGLSEYEDAKREADKEFADAERELQDARDELDEAIEDLAELETPETFVLGRWGNLGYECFENDTSIVQAISAVFPVFFFLVAALICLTTVSRMVEEQRSQLGVLLALGYSRPAVMGKFLFYAGAATVIGGASGILLGSWCIPMVVWKAYNIMYTFSDKIKFVFDLPLSAITFSLYVVAMLAVTLFTCGRELRDVPANIIRLKPPKSGKRVMLERVKFIWNRLSFLWKVTVRNIFRYKSRVLMMILGIAGCTALMITGMGINDSIRNVVDYQFTEISLYDYSVTFSGSLDLKEREEFLAGVSEFAERTVFLNQESASATAGRAEKEVQLNVLPADAASGIGELVDFHSGNKKLRAPQDGEILVNSGLADALGLRAGDSVTVRPDSGGTLKLTVCGVYDNYIYNSVYITERSFVEAVGEEPDINFALVKKAPDADAGEGLARILSEDGVLTASSSQELINRIGGMMDSLIYIVLLTIICAAALAFVVIYNLTNINIQERLREIATVKVLGFYDPETAMYVLRENILLTLLGAAAGIPMGLALNAYVVTRIELDMIHFVPRVLLPSYLWSVALTIAFSLTVDIFMLRRLARIDPAVALKAAE